MVEAIQDRTLSDGQQVQGGQHVGETVASVAEILVLVVAVPCQAIEALDSPAGQARALSAALAIRWTWGSWLRVKATCLAERAEGCAADAPRRNGCYSCCAMRERSAPHTLARRTFLRAVATAAGSASLTSAATERRFFTAFVPGSLGIKADQAKSISLASEFGFESVQPFPSDLSRDGPQMHVEALQRRGLRWAAAGLPVEFRKDDKAFEEGMSALPRAAAVLREAGADRVGTWLRPSSDDLTYLQNFKRTAARLRRVAQVLQEHGLRLGLEYVGTKRNWTAGRHSAVHTMAGTKDLIAETGMENIGFVLDSWHWWTSRETADDIRTLAGSDVISADLNDAPAGIEIEDQYDNQRELPLATSVINVRDFLQALVDIGYDGPIRAEPFNKALNEREDADACRLTVEALNNAFALVG